MTFLPESPKFQLAMGKPKESLDIMRKMYASNTGNPKEVSNTAIDPYYCFTIANFVIFQKYPVQSIAAPSATGTSFSEVTGVKETMRLVWNQTMPLFKPPYVINLLVMCGSMFTLFAVVHGQQFWYPQILSYYSKNVDLPLTTCEVIALGHELELNEAKNSAKVLNR